VSEPLPDVVVAAGPSAARRRLSVIERFEHTRLSATPHRGGGAVDLGLLQVRALAEIAPAQGYDVTGLARVIIREWLEAHGRAGTSAPAD